MRVARYSDVAVFGMVSILLLQGFHEFEHILQVVQNHVWNQPDGAGVLGTWVDVEWVHIGYNATFLGLTGFVYYHGRFWAMRKSSRLLFLLMTFVLLFQAWHTIEHVVIIVQYIETNMDKAPGVLGHFVRRGFLHLYYNTIVYVPFVVAFFLGGLHREVFAALRRTRSSPANSAA